MLDYAGWATKINYGSDKVRFPAPVPVGSRVRAGVEVLAVTRGPGRAPGGQQGHGRDRAAASVRPLVAETLTLLVD